MCIALKQAHQIWYFEQFSMQELVLCTHHGNSVCSNYFCLFQIVFEFSGIDIGDMNNRGGDAI